MRVAGPHERLVAQLASIKELSGLSLRALARQSGLSSSSLSRYLTGRLVPPWEAVVALCRAGGRDPRPLRAGWGVGARGGAGGRPPRPRGGGGGGGPRAGGAPAPRRNDLPGDLFDFT